MHTYHTDTTPSLSMSRRLVVGGSSGLGKYWAQRWDCPVASLHEVGTLSQKSFSEIAVCSNPVRKDEPAGLQRRRFIELINATQKLISKQPGVLVFVSSLEVAPLAVSEPLTEAPLKRNCANGSLYAKSKIEVENLLVRSRLPFVVLRPGLLLGNCSRRSSVEKLVDGDTSGFSLSAESTFYCSRYDDVIDTVDRALDSTCLGFFHPVPATPVSLLDLRERYSPAAELGRYTYTSPVVSNDRARALTPILGLTSMEIIEMTLI